MSQILGVHSSNGIEQRSPSIVRVQVIVFHVDVPWGLETRFAGSKVSRFARKGLLLGDFRLQATMLSSGYGDGRF